MSITADPPRSVLKPTILHHLVLLSLLVITMINYMQRNCIGTAATTIEKSLGIGGPALDAASAAFFWAYTFAMVPSSWLAERWGPRLALSVFAAGWSLSTLLCAFAGYFVNGFIDLYAGRLLMGILQAGIFPCATLIIAVWYPASRRGLATSLLNSFMLIGGAFGALLTGWLLDPLGRFLVSSLNLSPNNGWRAVFALFSVPGLVWAAWFYWWFRNRPEEHPGVNASELALLQGDRPPSKEKPAEVPWLLILTSVPLLLLFTQQAFRAGANRLFDSRLPTYFEVERDQSKAQAATLASLPQWAGVVGGVCGGMLSDWVLRRTNSKRLARGGVAIFSLLTSVGFYLCALPLENVWLAAGMLSLGAFVFCFSSPCAYALTIDIGGKHLAVIFGLMNMIGNLGSALFVNNVMNMVELGGWNLAFTVWIAMHLAAAACWAFLVPDRALPEPATGTASGAT